MKYLAALTALAAATPALAAPVQWPASAGGNDHYYERVEQTNITYAQAQAAAASMTYLGLPGHLVIFDGSTLAAYQPEFNFVDANVYAPGVTESRAYYVGADSPSGNSGTYTWVDGSPVPAAVSNTWNIDHNEGPGAEAATLFQTTSHTIWDYSSVDSLGYTSGFIVEYQSIPEPASLTLCALATLPLLRRKRSL